VTGDATMSDEAADCVAAKQPSDDWTRCHMYVERKKRFCRQQVVKGSCYCGNHFERRKRVPCPVDPSHLVYEDLVEKHVKVCPRVTRKQSQEEELFYRHNCNVEGHGSLCAQRDKTHPNAQELALKILDVYQRVFSNPLPRESLRLLTLQNLLKAIPELDLSESEMQAGLAESVQEYRIKSGGARHLQQQASLVGHLRRIGVMNGEENLTLLEVGAGRGMFGLVAAGVVAAASSHQEVHLCLVERSGSRSKADTVLRTANSQTKYMNLKRVTFSRIQCDLSHVHMPTVLDKVNSKKDEQTAGMKRKNRRPQKLVVIAKHLCGAGTDLALKSLQEVAPDALVMATCCHGVCSWENYVGRDFLKKVFTDGDNPLDFGPDEFELMRRWSSGTVAPECSRNVDKTSMADIGMESTSDTGMEKEQDEHGSIAMDDEKDPLNVSSICKSLGLSCGSKGLGRACQRLLDQGRCEFMRQILFCYSDKDECRIEMFHYVPPTVTPQNAVLIAHRVSKHK
jgi:tRNA:m4X modification enzyme